MKATPVTDPAEQAALCQRKWREGDVTIICIKCHIEKPLNEFHSNKTMRSGKSSKCVECESKYNAQHRRKNHKRFAEYDRARRKTQERKATNKRYQQTPLAKIRQFAATSVCNAVRDGRLVRQPCEKCGAEKAEGHHDDYTKPLSVRWLCRKHHMEYHGKRMSEQ